MFAARGIPIVVSAEHHASLLGALGAGFLSLDIWVAEADAEDASALLHDLRGAPAELPGGACLGLSEDGTALIEGEGEGDDDLVELVPSRTELRRRAGLAILLGCFVTFGTAHMVSRAPLRGLALAALEILGILRLTQGVSSGAAIVIGAIVTDLFGALWRLRVTPRPALPPARVRRS